VIVREAGRAMARISAESTQTSGFRLERSLGGALAPCYAGGRILHSRIAQDVAGEAARAIRMAYVKGFACEPAGQSLLEVFHQPMVFTYLPTFLFIYT
jgi:hypothetical protein